jgi:hypothetical protein
MCPAQHSPERFTQRHSCTHCWSTSCAHSCCPPCPSCSGAVRHCGCAVPCCCSSCLPPFTRWWPKLSTNETRHTDGRCLNNTWRGRRRRRSNRHHNLHSPSSPSRQRQDRIQSPVRLTRRRLGGELLQLHIGIRRQRLHKALGEPMGPLPLPSLSSQSRLRPMRHRHRSDGRRSRRDLSFSEPPVGHHQLIAHWAVSNLCVFAD